MINIKKFLPFILLIFIAGMAYINMLDSKFVFDDVSTVKLNRIITRLDNLSYLFSTDYFKPSGVADFTVSGEASYRPLVTFTYFLDHFFWGKKPVGYHLTNFMLHILVVLSFFLFLQSLIKNRIVAFLSSLLYAIHPVLTEAVNCISFREDLLCALFFWLALYIHLLNRPLQLKKTFLICLAFLLCVFSKEMGIIFLPAVIVIDFFILKKDLRFNFLLKEYLPLAIATVFYMFIRFHVMKNPYEPPLPHQYKFFYQNTGAMFEIFVYYLKILFYPLNLTLDYSAYFPNVLVIKKSIWCFVFLTSLISVSLCIVFISRRRENIPYKAVSVILFFLSLMPVSNIIPIKNIIAERYLYLPFGFFSLFFANLFFLKSDCYRRLKILLFLLIPVCYISLTLYLNYTWSDGYLLWKRTLKVNPLSFHAHNNLAGMYFDRNLYEPAKYHYSQAIYIRPFDAIPYYNLANTYSAQGNYVEAIANYKNAARRDRLLIEPYVNMGITYSKMGDYDKAIAAFKQAITVNNRDSSAHNNLGVALSNKGLLDQAIEEHIIAIKLNPDNKNAYKNLALCYFDKRDYHKTLTVMRKLVKIQPDQDENYLLMGQCFEILKNRDNAIKCYKQALTINPDNKMALKRFKDILNQ